MIIIGHRGAAGIEPENTLPSIESAVTHGVDMIEFDLQKTKDNHLIVFHDDNLLRLAGKNIKISDMTLKQINLTATHSGHPIPSFHEAMEAVKTIPVLLDCKGKGWAKLLNNELPKYPNHIVSITAQDRNELAIISKLRPDIETYISELTKPFDAIYSAKALGLTGISLNFWVLNPLSYWYAKRKKCKIMVFTINHTWMARFIHRLYPDAAIITNVPNKLIDKLKRPNDKSKAST
jgi:glycerophosphoryl diester phosphodiesterase